MQYFLIPFLLKDGFLSLLVANTLYAVAFAQYYYITFLGYSALPFLRNTGRFLIPITIIFILYLSTLILQINLTQLVLKHYYSHEVVMADLSSLSDTGSVGSDLIGEGSESIINTITDSIPGLV